VEPTADPHARHEPPALDERAAERCCLACRKPGDRDELLRFVLGPEGELVFDGLRKLPGRGANLCATPVCLLQARERRGFERAFGRSVKVGSAAALLAQVTGWHQARLLDLLGLARRCGRLRAGGDEVERSLARGETKLLLLAADLAAARREELAARAHTKGSPVFVAETMARLGSAVGRPPTGILGVAEGPQLAPLLRTVERLVKFGGALFLGDGQGRSA